MQSTGCPTDPWLLRKVAQGYNKSLINQKLCTAKISWKTRKSTDL
jgi:hypothetical protein